MKTLLIILTIIFFFGCHKKVEKSISIEQDEVKVIEKKDNTFTVKYQYHGGINFEVKAYIFTNTSSPKGYVIIKSIKANDDLYIIDFTGDRYTEMIHNHKMFTANNGKYCLEDNQFRDIFRSAEAMATVSRYQDNTVLEPAVYQAGKRMLNRKYGLSIK